MGWCVPASVKKFWEDVLTTSISFGSHRMEFLIRKALLSHDLLLADSISQGCWNQEDILACAFITCGNKILCQLPRNV